MDDTSTLGALLSEFESRLAAERAPVLDQIVRPASSTDTVTHALIQFAGTAPAELVSWFDWQVVMAPGGATSDG